MEAGQHVVIVSDTYPTLTTGVVKAQQHNDAQRFYIQPGMIAVQPSDVSEVRVGLWPDEVEPVYGPVGPVTSADTDDHEPMTGPYGYEALAAWYGMVGRPVACSPIASTPCREAVS